MFAIIFESVGVGEWLVLLAVLLIVVGPKRLPSTARKFGQYYSKFRRAAESFKRQLLEMDTEINNAVNQVEQETSKAFESVGDEATAEPSPTDAYDDPSSYYPEEDMAGTGEPDIPAVDPDVTPDEAKAEEPAKPESPSPAPEGDAKPAEESGR